MRIWAAILIFSLLLPFRPVSAADTGESSAPPPARPCGVSFRGIALGTLKAGLKTGLHVGLSVPKALTLPLWLPAHAAWLTGSSLRRGEGKAALWKVPLRLVLRNGLAGLAWGAMFLSARGTIMTTYEMDQFALGDDKDDPDDLIVFVNAFNDNDDPVFHEAVERYYEHKYAGQRRRVKLNPENMQDLRNQLEALAKREGKRIKRVEFYGHGIKGGVDVHDEAVGANELLERADDLRLRGVFEKNAKTIFYSCWTGDGKDGKEFMDTWGRLMYDRGGSVYGSKITLGGSPYLFSDLVATPYLAFVGRGDAQDQEKSGNPYYRWDKFTKIEIPERARVLAPGEE